MSIEALTTLEKLSAGAESDGKRNKRERRRLRLLRSPDAADERWFMNVPVVFNDAL